MDCKEVKQNLSSYLDGELTAAKAEAVKTHLYSCPDCRQEYETLSKISLALQQMGKNVFLAPAGFKEAIMQRIQEDASQPVLLRWRERLQQAGGHLAGVVAAALLLFFTAVGINWSPALQMAEKSPANGKTAINAPAPSKTQETGNQETTTNIDNETPEQIPSDSTDNPARVEGLPQVNSVPDINNFSPAAVLLSQNSTIRTTMLTIKAEDPAAAREKALALATSYKAQTSDLARQASATGNSSIINIAVPRSRAEELTGKLATLGTVVNQQENSQDISARYSETMEQYLALSNERQATQDKSKQAQLDKQMEALQKQLTSWQAEVERETIVLVLQG